MQARSESRSAARSREWSSSKQQRRCRPGCADGSEQEHAWRLSAHFCAGIQQLPTSSTGAGEITDVPVLPAYRQAASRHAAPERPAALSYAQQSTRPP